MLACTDKTHGTKGLPKRDNECETESKAPVSTMSNIVDVTRFANDSANLVDEQLNIQLKANDLKDQHKLTNWNQVF